MNIFKNSFKTQAILNLKEFFSNGSNWLFLGKQSYAPNTPLLDTIENDIKNKSQILALYKLKSDDFSCVVKRNDWVSNKIYKEYSSDENLNPTDYYITTIVNNTLKVWICISNSNNSISNVPPGCDNVDPTDTYNLALCLLEDNYNWKLIYTIDNYQQNPFSTEQYFPIENTFINSTPQQILKINITGNTNIQWNIPRNNNQSSLYYVSGYDTNMDIVYLHIPQVNSGFNTTSDYYKDWFIVLSHPQTNVIKHISKIESSNYINTGLISIQTCENLPDTIDNYRFSLVPGLNIVGDGSGFVGYPVINSNQTITSIGILNPGNNYGDLSINVIGLENNYLIKPIFSPRKQLSYSVINTLKTSELMFYKKISASGIDSYNKNNPEVVTISSLDYESNSIEQFGFIQSELNDPVSDLPIPKEKLVGCDLLYQNTWDSSNIFSLAINDYVCTLDANNKITASGKLISISISPSNTGLVLGVLPYFGSFSSLNPNLKKLVSLSTLETETITPSFSITNAVKSEYVKQSGRIIYVENIEPSIISTNTSLNIRVIISL